MIDERYDSSWNESGNDEAWQMKEKEWETRDWEDWLTKQLSFPFIIKRVEDEDDAYFTDIAERKPFRLGHTMTVLGIEMEDDLYGIIVKVRENRRIGAVPLCDVEVSPKDDRNYWPVKEYVVWFANR